jgi:hypothetical protein
MVNATAAALVRLNIASSLLKISRIVITRNGIESTAMTGYKIYSLYPRRKTTDEYDDDRGPSDTAA